MRVVLLVWMGVIGALLTPYGAVRADTPPSPLAAMRAAAEEQAEVDPERSLPSRRELVPVKGQEAASGGKREREAGRASDAARADARAVLRAEVRAAVQAEVAREVQGPGPGASAAARAEGKRDKGEKGEKGESAAERGRSAMAQAKEAANQAQQARLNRDVHEKMKDKMKDKLFIPPGQAMGRAQGPR